MKCKICGGTGTSNTCVNGTFKPCTFCDGTGEYEPFDVDVELDKLYPPVQTNEEWLKSMNTEQLAEWILDVSDECFDCGKSDNGDCPFGKAQGVCTCINKDSVVEWLKQPHTTEVGK